MTFLLYLSLLILIVQNMDGCHGFSVLQIIPHKHPGRARLYFSERHPEAADDEEEITTPKGHPRSTPGFQRIWPNVSTSSCGVGDGRGN